MNPKCIFTLIPASSRSTLGVFCKVVCALVFTAALSPSLKAQTEPEFVNPPREHREFLNKAREGELENTRPVTQRQKLKLAEIREDFRRIQSINNETIRPSISKSEVKFEKIAKASSEIERRANRLKTNLALPPAISDTSSQQQASQTSVDALKRLDDAIWTFVSNPIFKTAGVLDVQQSEKASRDLQEIIEVSRWLKRNVNHTTR